MPEHHVPQHPASEPTAQRQAPACVVCGSRLLQLLDAEPHPPGGWNVLLECPECWSVLDEHLSDDEIEAFDSDFDEGMRQIVEELRRLTARHMLEEVERFAGALQAGAILPEDF